MFLKLLNKVHCYPVFLNKGKKHICKMKKQHDDNDDVNGGDDDNDGHNDNSDDNDFSHTTGSCCANPPQA